jgi:hypothetical protein
MKEEAAAADRPPSLTEPGDRGPNKTKAIRIRELENELEETWCLVDGLAPITNTGLACLLLFFNVLSPGLGTLISVCCAPSDYNGIEPIGKGEVGSAVDPQDDGLALNDTLEDDAVPGGPAPNPIVVLAGLAPPVLSF